MCIDFNIKLYKETLHMKNNQKLKIGELTLITCMALHLFDT